MGAPLKSKSGPSPSAVALRVRRERERLGLSLAQVGDLLGVDRQSYRQLEITANPQYSRLVELADVVGMNPEAIATELFRAKGLPPTLTLVFAARPDGRAGLAGETEADDELVRELVPAKAIGPAWYVDRSTIERLIQAAGEKGVRLVIRADLPPRELPPAGPAPEPPARKPRAKGGKARPG